MDNDGMIRRWAARLSGRRDATPEVPEGPRRLHWGCGRAIAKGWINADLVAAPGVDLVGDIRAGLPLPDASMDAIVSQHALVMLSLKEIVPGLEELRRVLRPGGVLRMGLPDFDRGVRAYVGGEDGYFKLIADKDARTRSGKLLTLLLWHGHTRTPLTWEFTEELCLRAKFSRVVRCAYRETKSGMPDLADLDNRPEESFFFEATR